MEIRTNQQFLELAARGLCGNTPQVYMTLQDFLNDPRAPEQVFISTTTWDNFRLYHQTKNDVKTLLSIAKGGLVKHPTRSCFGVLRNMYCMANPPHDLQERHEVFQCDWVPTDRWLRYAVTNQPWGRTKRDGKTFIASGVVAIRTLEHFLAESVDDLFDLTEIYPTAIIEATMFPFKFGTYGRRLLIWEVRDY